MMRATAKHLATMSAVALLAGFSHAATVQAATDVGVAAAVNPAARGAAPGVGGRTLSIGKRIFFNERITTNAGGLVNVLFIDGSSITVGPNSNVVIDKFVYNPRKDTGEMAATLTKGVMRYIGGKLSKQAGRVNFKTPMGTVGVRGTNQIFSVPDLSVSNVSGSMTVQDPNGQTRTITTESTLSTVGGTTQVTPGIPTRITTTVSTNLTGTAGSGGGGAGASTSQVSTTSQSTGVTGSGSASTTPPNSTAANTVTTGGGNSSNLQNTVQNSAASNNAATSEGNRAANGGLEVTTTTGEPVVVGLDGTVTSATTGEPLPPFDQVRVLSPSSSYSAFSSGGGGFVELTDPGSTGVVGNDPDGSAGDIADEVIGVTISGGRVSGTSSEGDTFNVPLPTTDGLTVITDGFSSSGPLTGTVFRNGGSFFFYYLFENEATLGKNDPALALAGTGPILLTGEGNVRTYALNMDQRQLINIPFASTNFAPSDTSFVKISDLYVIEQDSGAIGGSGSGASQFLQVSAGIRGQGPGTQQSFTTMVAGPVNQVDGNPRLIGGRRGSARLTTTVTTTNLSGGFGSIAGPAGNHFFGTNGENLVVGGGIEVGDPFFDRPTNPPAGSAASNTFSTYHVASLTNPNTPQSTTQTTRTLQGYAGGILEASNRIAGSLSDVVFATTGVGDFTINFDATSNQVNASALIRDVNSEDAERDRFFITFGGGRRSGFVNDDIYGARQGSTGATTVTTDSAMTFATDTIGGTAPNRQSREYLIPSTLVGFDNVLPAGVAFCSACEFIEWGFWGERFSWRNGSGFGRNDFFHFGTWAAGAVDPVGSLPTSLVATFNGHAIGPVSEVIATVDHRYVAVGNFSLTYNFGPRTGTYAISNFAGRSVSGTVSQVATPASVNQFSGALAGSGLTGTAIGSFVGGPLGAASGVVSNFHLSGPDFRATGIGIGRR